MEPMDAHRSANEGGRQAGDQGGEGKAQVPHLIGHAEHQPEKRSERLATPSSASASSAIQIVLVLTAAAVAAAIVRHRRHSLHECLHTRLGEEPPEEGSDPRRARKPVLRPHGEHSHTRRASRRLRRGVQLLGVVAEGEEEEGEEEEDDDDEQGEEERLSLIHI